MTTLRLLRGELRKLTTTKLPWGFLAVLIVIAGLNAAIVGFGTDTDGSKAFVATAADQQSLLAFAFNALLGTALFGAIAAAREYGHGTVVPTFLTSPNRTRAVTAQLAAVLLAGAALALIGQTLMIAAVSVALQATQYAFMVSAGHVIQLLVASSVAGAIGAVLGAGLGMVIRNTGGAVTTAVLVVFLIPPLAVQLVSAAASWIPTALLAVLSGVSSDVSIWAALMAVAAWALVPAAAGLVAVQRRDVA
jgi:ABC-type transport system involved in multi-copper enzyme maturation permease subunit